MFNQALGLDDEEPEASVPVTATETPLVAFAQPSSPAAGLQHDKILGEVDEDLKVTSRHALATGLQVLERIFDYDPRQQGRMAEVAAQLLNTATGAASERRKSAQKDQEIQLKKLELTAVPNKGLGGIGKVDNMQLNVFTGDRNALMEMIREAADTAPQPAIEQKSDENGTDE